MGNAERLLAWLCLTACTREPAVHEVPQAAPVPAPTHFLGETFRVASSECALTDVASTLSELAEPPAGLAADDLSVIVATLRCEPALPASVRATWIDQAHARKEASRRSKLARQRSDVLVFESEQAGTMPVHRYDARSGEPQAAMPAGTARLIVGDVVVAPWTRMHDRALEGFFDALARSLALGEYVDPLVDDREGRAAWQHAVQWLAEARAFDGSAPLELRPIEVREGQPRLVLALRDVRLELELARGPQGQPWLARVLDPVGTQQALACAQRGAELRAALSSEPRALCNVLGTMLPASCSTVPAALRARALQQGSECRGSGALALDVGEREPAPADFAVTLRRAASLSNLGARSELTLARSGRVHLTRTARSDEGLTSPEMLAALYGAVARLGWFERASTGISVHCASDERADLITVRAHGRERKLRDRDGCRGEFTAEELDTFKRTIEHAAALDAWQSHGTPDAARDAEIWVVAAE